MHVPNCVLVVSRWCICSSWVYCAPFCPLRSTHSILVHFSPFRPIRSIVVEFGPFQFISVHLVYFGLFQSNSVYCGPHWSILVQFSPFPPTLVRSIHFSPLWFIRSRQSTLLHFSPFKVLSFSWFYFFCLCNVVIISSKPL